MDVDVDVEVPWSSKCYCGKTFYQPNSFSNHIRSCSRYKSDVGTTLQEAKERYAQRKKQKRGREAIESWYGDAQDSLDIDQELNREEAIATTVPNPEEPVPCSQSLWDAGCAIPFDIPMAGLAVVTPPASPSPGPSAVPQSAATDGRLAVLEHSTWKVSRKNGFNLYKVYWTLETRPHDPDLYLSNSDLREDDEDRLAMLSQPGRPPTGSGNPYHPFPNWSSYKIGDWYWSEGGEKSRESFQRLVNVICDEDFCPADLRRANWKRIDASLAASEFDDAFGDDESQWAGDGMSWKTASITVEVPFNSTSLRPGSKPFTIQDFRFRPLVPLIRAKLENAHASEHFHYVPSELWWERNKGQGESRVYGELYHSDAFLEAYRAVQLLPKEKDEDDLPRCVIALMFASDDTMLASFGDAKLWPVYLCFGNESKYRRSKTSLKLLEEAAYFQSLPDSFSDWYIKESGKNTVGRDVKTHVKRELFHAQWRALLDDDFLYAYMHGLVVACPDGVKRRFYPRILTYSADYPERARVVGIRNIGECPCPRCFIKLGEIAQLGTEDDETRRGQKRVDDDERREKVEKARALIYDKNYAVDADKVNDLLQPTSLVPAQNAFSERLSSAGFDMHDMVAVDILHEVEIGVWKSLFIHLLRLLQEVGAGTADILDSRYRQTPSFGRDTIRRFSRNASAMKQLGARDFEDLLQCAIPAFEGLFPDEDNGRVMDLLFVMAYWHALAKLRMHNDISLALLDRWTSILGERCRSFLELTCDRFQTRELKREYEARMRREARKDKEKNAQGVRKKAVGSSSSSLPSPAGPGGAALSTTKTSSVLHSGASVSRTSTGQSGRQLRGWNLSTPKFHSLGDVVSYIKRFGTTDSYSTQLSERFHRFPKARYRRTNKKNFSLQMSQIQTRQARIKKLRAQLHPSQEEVDFLHPWALPDAGDPQYFIGKSQNQPVNLSHFIALNAADPAATGFMMKLRRHLFPRIVAALIREVEANPGGYPDSALATLRATASSEPSESDLNSIYFHSDTIYRHNVMKIPYTTYDCRQDSDTINPRTSRRDFMCLPAPDPHVNEPELDTLNYVYGRVLGIFHANVVYGGTGALDYRRRRFDFLWARWFIPLSNVALDDLWLSLRLERVGLAPISQSDAWDFVDPANVLRAVHIIPRFSLGQLHEEVPLPAEGNRSRKGKGMQKDPDVESGQGSKRRKKHNFSRCAQDEHDWKEYYVNRFVDRDMVMRFHRGTAVGHSYSQSGNPSMRSPSVERDAPMDVDNASGALDPHHAEKISRANDSDDSTDGNGLTTDEERLGRSGRVEQEGESDEEDSFYATEPDSEEDADVYGGKLRRLDIAYKPKGCCRFSASSKRMSYAFMVTSVDNQLRVSGFIGLHLPGFQGSMHPRAPPLIFLTSTPTRGSGKESWVVKESKQVPRKMALSRKVFVIWVPLPRPLCRSPPTELVHQSAKRRYDSWNDMGTCGSRRTASIAFDRPSYVSLSVPRPAQVTVETTMLDANVQQGGDWDGTNPHASMLHGSTAGTVDASGGSSFGEPPWKHNRVVPTSRSSSRGDIGIGRIYFVGPSWGKEIQFNCGSPLLWFEDSSKSYFAPSRLPQDQQTRHRERPLDCHPYSETWYKIRHERMGRSDALNNVPRYGVGAAVSSLEASPGEKHLSALSWGPRKRPNLHTDPLIHHGRHFGRSVFAFANIHALIISGLSADEDSPPETQQLSLNDGDLRRILTRSYRERRELRVFKKLLSMIPGFEDRLMSSSEEEMMAIASMLQKGAASARSDDTKSLKGVILDWIGPLDPPLSRNVKHNRGFHHDRTGFLLCPSELDWTDPEVKNQLRNKELTVTGSHWPIFVYKNERYDPDDPWKGLFRNELLGFKHIFTSPSSVEQEPKATRSGNARIHGMTYVSPASLAYAFTQVRFALSSAGVFSRTDSETDSETFYTSVLELLEDPFEQDEGELRESRRIFPSFSTARRLAPAASALARIRAKRQSLMGTADPASPQSDQ
ncbi:hypothetical protein NMY22_g988 [Coprinellus aureogranulatus]|nr:hypothetical protein NMY22_g988 [Coprinellus aureogranulatus]